MNVVRVRLAPADCGQGLLVVVELIKDVARDGTYVSADELEGCSIFFDGVFHEPVCGIVAIV